MSDLVRVGSRQSELALAQAKIVVDSLKSSFPHCRFEIVAMKTRGDKMLEVSLSKVGGKGLFVKEIEEALLNKDIDMAVHSLKDMPYELPPGLEICAVLDREDPRDVFIGAKGVEFKDLREGALVGTSSLRRASQVKAMRPDIETAPLRGNVLTRIEKIETQNLDGIVLAAAGIKRLGLADLITHYFDVQEIIPAVGQGALAVEIRANDKIAQKVKTLDHLETSLAVCAERSFMMTLGGSCHIPMGALADIEGGEMSIMGMFETQGQIRRGHIRGPIDRGEEMGIELARELGGLL